VRLLALTVAVTALIAAPAAADPVVNGVFNMPGVTTNGQLAVGPDGNVWAALESAVAKVQPEVKAFG
jgi:hypothetical protein